MITWLGAAATGASRIGDGEGNTIGVVVACGLKYPDAVGSSPSVDRAKLKVDKAAPVELKRGNSLGVGLWFSDGQAAGNAEHPISKSKMAHQPYTNIFFMTPRIPPCLKIDTRLHLFINS